jgi:hypothetical protein
MAARYPFVFRYDRGLPPSALRVRPVVNAASLFDAGIVDWPLAKFRQPRAPDV